MAERSQKVAGTQWLLCSVSGALCAGECVQYVVWSCLWGRGFLASPGSITSCSAGPPVFWNGSHSVSNIHNTIWFRSSWRLNWFLICVLLSFSAIHVTAAFLLVSFKIHGRSIYHIYICSIYMEHKGFRVRKETDRVGVGQNSTPMDLVNVKILQWSSFCSVLKVFTPFWFCWTLQLRRNLLMRQAMMHFSVVQVKCCLNTSLLFVLVLGSSFPAL